MIITRTPLRISFVGGGSDLPAFYREEIGATVTAAIDKYVYVTVSEKFDGSIRAAYSVTENVARVEDLRHELIREALKLWGLTSAIEVHSIADIPGGTGLGSSSAFTVGLLTALDNHRRTNKPNYGLLNTAQLADEACEIEIERCQHPIGKQDQYATAFGGVNLLRFHPDERVDVQPIACDADALSQHLLLLYTGQVRNGDAGQHIANQRQDQDDVRTLAIMALEFSAGLANGDLRACGQVMERAWAIKRRVVATPQLDAWYVAARQAGAWGGKLCGAGGGGFLAFLAPPERHAAIAQATGLRHVPVRAGVSGCEVIHASI